MRKNLTALYIKMGGGPENLGTTSSDKEKTPIINYIIGNQKSLRTKFTQLLRNLNTQSTIMTSEKACALQV